MKINIPDYKMILKLFLPPILVTLYKKIIGDSSHSTFEGVYKNFNEVNDITPYASKNTQKDIYKNLTNCIDEYQKNNFLPVAHIRSQITNLLPLLISSIDKKQISLLDYGGGAGESFIDCINKINIEKKIDYFVFDLKTTMKIGKEVFLDFEHKYCNISFVNNLTQLRSLDIVYFGSSLQYFPDYKLTLLSVIAKEPKYIFLTDNFMGNHSTYVTTQINMTGRKMAYWIFEFEEIVNFLNENKYSLVYSSSNFQPFHNFDNFPLDKRVSDTSNLLFKNIRFENVKK
jgi:putative methyltransferase (TIGR04325 family)